MGHLVGLGYISRDGENWKKPYLGLGGDEFSITHIDVAVSVFHILEIFNKQIDTCIWSLEEVFVLGI